MEVAQAFARQHGYAAGPIGDIARFVQAMQVPASECGHALILFSLEFFHMFFFRADVFEEEIRKDQDCSAEN